MNNMFTAMTLLLQPKMNKKFRRKKQAYVDVEIPFYCLYENLIQENRVLAEYNKHIKLQQKQEMEEGEREAWTERRDPGGARPTVCTLAVGRRKGQTP